MMINKTLNILALRGVLASWNNKDFSEQVRPHYSGSEAPSIATTYMEFLIYDFKHMAY